MSTITLGDRDAPLFGPDADWDAAQAVLLDAELADGLPLVVPTAARLAAMLAAPSSPPGPSSSSWPGPSSSSWPDPSSSPPGPSSSWPGPSSSSWPGLTGPPATTPATTPVAVNAGPHEREMAATDPSASFGFMPPLFGELTAEAVAYCCVLAGCRPAEFPVVLQAALATLEPEFNLLGIQTTTGTPTAAVLVHGPLTAELGMNAGTNCLGPGNRANACIGRAVRLVLTCVGGARPPAGDMATMGQPAKYGMAFAEGTHPWVAPLHVRRGLDASAVTVIGLSGTIEVLPEAGASIPEAVLRPVLAAMQGARQAGSGGRQREPGEQFLLLPPEMADVIAKAGWTLEQAQSFLWGESGSAWPIARAPGDIQIIVTGGAGVKMTCLVPWGGGTFCVTRPVG